MSKSPYIKEQSSIHKLIGFVVILIFVFALGWNVGVAQNQRDIASIQGDTALTSGNEKVDMQLFWDVWSILASKYVEPQDLNFQEMVYGSIRGMVFSLNDPYTTFLTPKENKNFQDSLDGTLEGIGAELTLRNEKITVVSPLKNSPAKKAGLRPEDIIIKIDGENANDFSFEQAVMKIRGPKGTKVVLSVQRKGDSDLVELSITRRSISVSSVDWEMKGDIAWVELNQFGTNTRDEFSKVINSLLSKRPKGIVLDLRYNGGGYLDGAVDIASEFIQQGKVVSIKKRNRDQDEVIYVNGKARLANLPLVVLINKGSASASEIVAGAIQDHNRGIVIGEQSFGKGTVQEVQSLIDGSSLRVTIAKWYTPNDINISETGITPDIEIERSIEDVQNQVDPQLDAALDYLNKKVKS